MSNIKVFISFYHDDDQCFKDELISFNNKFHMFVDNSVDTGDIDDSQMSDEQIRIKIRDDYIKDTDVFVLLCGKNTKHRKHIDWEIHAAMYKSSIKDPIPILVLNLPSARNGTRKNNDIEKTIIEKHLPYKPNWVSFTTYKEYKDTYPDLPERLLKSLANKQSPVAIVNYESLFTNELEELIVSAYSRKNQFDYDDTDPLRRKDGANE